MRCAVSRWCATTRSATWAGGCRGRWRCSTTAATGVVLTSIHGRSEARTYAKNVSGWTSDQQLSPEEQDAISGARADATD